MFDRIKDWFEAKDWRTWLSHVLMAGGIGLLASSAWTGFWVYLWREVEQVYQEQSAHGWARVKAKMLDHILDVAVPFLVLGLGVAFGWWS